MADPTQQPSGLNMVTDAAAADEAAQQQQAQGQVMAKAPASTGLTSKMALDPTQTAEMKAQMQKFIDEREGFLPNLARGLTLGMATAKGPGALAAIQRQQDLEAKQIMDYRQQMQAYQAASDQAQRFAQRKAGYADVGGGTGGAGGAGAGGAKGNLIPGVNMVNYAGTQMPREFAMALDNAADQDEFKQIWNTKVLPFTQKFAEISGNPALDSGTMKVQIKRPDGTYAPTEVSVREVRMNPDLYILSPAQKQAIQAPSTSVGGKGEFVDVSSLTKDPDLLRIAGGESSFKNVPNLGGTSSAYGVYQITKPTFDLVVSNNPDLKNLTWEAFKANPEIQTTVAERLKKSNDALLEKQNIPKNALNQHTVWFSGDTKLATAPAETPIEQVMKPDQIAANKLAGKTAGEVRDMLQKRQDAGQKTLAGLQQGAPAKTEAEVIPTYEESLISQQAASEYGKGSGQQQAKDIADEYKTFRAGIDTIDLANKRQMASRNLAILGKPGNEKIAGQLNDPGFITGVMTMLRDGIQTPYGAVGMANIEDAMVRMAPDAGPEMIKDRNELSRNLGESGLVISSLMKGQGATSNFEREIYQRVVGSLRDNPELLKKLQVMVMARMDLNEVLGEMHDKADKSGKPFDYKDFKKSSGYKMAVADYEKKLNAILGADMNKLKNPEDARKLMAEAANEARNKNPEAYDRAQKEQRKNLVEKHRTAQ